jgi:hypothetical protein
LSLGHRLKGHQSRERAHEINQIFSPATEKAIVKWILKLDDYGFPPRLDLLWQLVEKLEIKEQEALKEPYNAEGSKNMVYDAIGKNWIPQFLNRHPILAAKFVQRKDCQPVFANNPVTITDLFQKLGRIIHSENIKPYAITNVDEKGIILGNSARFCHGAGSVGTGVTVSAIWSGATTH